MKIAIVGGGCFWCIEAILQRLKGVVKVRSGYAGGKTQNPTYNQVCSGKSGHAEVCQITYNPTIISFRNLIDVFLRIHDPTTLNKQGHDSGTQYRSIIFYQTEQEKQEIKSAIKDLDASKFYPDKAVTQVSKLEKFYVAEEDHQNYYNDNKQQGYCKMVILPKLGKLMELFKDKIDNAKF